MEPFFAFIEHSDLSELIRSSESLAAFPTIITIHAIGLALLAGGNAAIDLRVLGFAPGIPLRAMGRFLPLLWLAFALNAVTGTLLLIAYPTKAFTNWVFYFKLVLIVLAVTSMYRIGATVLRAPDADQKPVVPGAKVLALASIVLWAAIILAGRMLGYTHKWELLGVPSVL